MLSPTFSPERQALHHQPVLKGYRRPKQAQHITRLPRGISHLQKLPLRIPQAMLFSSLNPGFFHKFFPQISEATAAFCTKPRGGVLHSSLLLTEEISPACTEPPLFSASTRSRMKKRLNSHSPSTLLMPVSVLITFLLNHPFPAPKNPSLLTQSFHWRYSLSDHPPHSPLLYLFP